MMSQTKKSIQIDANPMIMNECLEAYAMGNEKEGRRRVWIMYRLACGAWSMRN